MLCSVYYKEVYYKEVHYKNILTIFRCRRDEGRQFWEDWQTGMPVLGVLACFQYMCFVRLRGDVKTLQA